MKKVLQIASASIVGISMLAGVAAADSVSATCGSISNTGQGSTNVVNCVTSTNQTVTCDNNIIVLNDNDQNAGSGNAFSSDNTTGGIATSGDANNSNAVNVTVGASCGATVATVTPATPATPAGGQGAGTPAATPAAQVVAPAGSVHAGAGGAPTKVSAASVAGVVGSAATLGLGVALRKKAFQS